jgi:hypothetical protein
MQQKDAGRRLGKVDGAFWGLNGARILGVNTPTAP